MAIIKSSKILILSYIPSSIKVTFFFSAETFENNNLEDIFKEFAAQMPLRGYKLLQVNHTFTSVLAF